MASEHVLFDNQTFLGPFPTAGIDAGLVARSAEIDNPNTAFKSAKAILQYSGIDPDGGSVVVGFTLAAVIEEAVAGYWTPQAEQFDPVKGTDEAINQIVELSPKLNLNPGSPNKAFRGSVEMSSSSHTDGTAGEKLRVSVYMSITDASKPQLTSLTVSGVLSQY